jgi:hypothetical protein
MKMKRVFQKNIILFVLLSIGGIYSCNGRRDRDVQDSIAQVNRKLDSLLYITDSMLKAPRVRVDTNVDLSMDSMPVNGIPVDSSRYSKEIFVPAKK